MNAWLSWLFKAPAAADPPGDSRAELRALKLRRHELTGLISTRRAYGFDDIAADDEQMLKSLDRRILALQLKLGSDAGDHLLR